MKIEMIAHGSNDLLPRMLDEDGMSPLQYIKNLRLQEARQLMMNDSIDASSAAV